MAEKMDRNGVVVMTLICAVACANAATDGYDSSMMVRLELY